MLFRVVRMCLITSQDVTTPKPRRRVDRHGTRLITSQDVTTPKRLCRVIRERHRLITSQDVTTPKLIVPCEYVHFEFNYQSGRHYTKTLPLVDRTP